MHIGQALEFVSRYDSLSDDKDGGKSEGIQAESTKLLRIVRYGHEDADDASGCFTRPHPGVNT